MTTRPRLLAARAVAVAGAGVPAAATAAGGGPAGGAAAVSGPGHDQPLGIALEGFPSPFPVRYLRLVIEGEHVNMAYVDLAPRGEPSGRTVLLLHGKNFDGGAWEPTARAFVAAGHRVVVPDQIGFGRSSKPALKNYSFELLASNTVTLLDRLGVERADVVGHSMGGMLAVRFALRHPARARKLVLANPVGLEDYRDLVPALPTERLFADELANTDLAAIRAFYRAYVVRWRPAYERNVAIRYRVTLGAEYPRWAMASALTYQMAYHQPVVADLPKLRLPVLLVIGQHDRTAIGKPYAAPEGRAKLGNYPVLGKRAAAAIPGARLVEFDDAGHLPHLERGARFEREVLAFLRRD